MHKFEVGKTYYGRSVCDYDCIITVTVASRTAKFITTDEGKRLGVKPMYDGSAEYVSPWGHYSMSPIVIAERLTPPK